jgi:hypothetical protein
MCCSQRYAELEPPPAKFPAAAGAAVVPLFLSLISNWKLHPIPLPLSPREPRPLTWWPDDGQCLRLTSSKSLLETPLPHSSILFDLFSLFVIQLVAWAQSKRVRACVRAWKLWCRLVGRFCAPPSLSVPHKACVGKETPASGVSRVPERERACRDRCGTPQW